MGPNRESNVPARSSSRVLLEVCIASADDAAASADGGADRVELNCALELGGLTPSPGALVEVRETCRLPVVCMIRPRPGGFCYTAAEYRTLRRDVDLVMGLGAAGVAFGVLAADGRVDLRRCREVVRQAGPAARDVVFHRAFDFTPDPLEALEQLIDLGVRRVMTSGQRPGACEGAGLIADLIRRSAGRIEVMAAGGVRPGNVAALVARTGCGQVHGSLREPRADASLAARPDLPLGGDPGAPGGGYAGTSRRMVAGVVAALRAARAGG